MASPTHDNPYGTDGSAGSSASAGTVARRIWPRFTSKEAAVLLVAAAVAVIGTAAAAISPNRATASAAPSAVPVASAPSSSSAAHSCPLPAAAATVTATVAATPAASVVTTPAAAATTATASTSTKRKSTTSAAKKKTSTAKKKSKTATSTAESDDDDDAPALVTLGTQVTYGTWGGSPLRWRVVHADSSAVVLLSQYVITAGAFQSDWEGKAASAFGGSEVRSWLRNEFGTKAFSAEESAALLPHVGGSAGSERVFLLSVDEVKSYLPKASARKAAPHSSAGSGALGYSSSALSLKGPYAAWWLADAASGDAYTARVVRADGKLGSELVYYPDLGVRPAIRVDPNKIVYSLDPQGGN